MKKNTPDLLTEHDCSNNIGSPTVDTKNLKYSKNPNISSFCNSTAHSHSSQSDGVPKINFPSRFASNIKMIVLDNAVIL